MTKNTKQEADEVKCDNYSLLLMTAVGFSFYWACVFTILFLGPKLFQEESAIWLSSLCRISMVVGLLVAGSLISWKADYFATTAGHRFLSGGVVALLVVTGVLVFVGSFLPGQALGVLVCMAGVCAGVGFACMLLLWAEFFASFKKRFASKALCGAVVVGVVFYLALNNLPLYLGVAAFCAFPLVSLGVLRLLKREVAPVAFLSRKKTMEQEPLLLATDFFIAIYGLGVGFAINLALQFGEDRFFSIGIAFALIVGAALTNFFLKRNKEKMLHGEAQRVIFPLLIIGLLLMTFAEGAFSYMGAVILLMSYIGFSIVNMDSQISMAQKYGCSTFYYIGRGGMPLLAGIAVGLIAGLGILFLQGGGSLLLSAIPLGLVVILAIAITFIPVEKDRLSKPDDGEKNVGHWKNRCSLVAQEFGLSKRETEVFTLLAKGRRVEYIQNALFISTHTVKTHTYNIYKKMGINSREELIDIVEGKSPRV